MKNLCDRCTHDKTDLGCEYYCTGVDEWDEENEIVTSCQDYKTAEDGDGDGRKTVLRHSHSRHG